MRAEDLMIGECVYNSNHEKCKVRSVSEIFDSNITLDNYDKENDGCFEQEFEVDPIPLTADKLMETFPKYEGVGSVAWSPNEDGSFTVEYHDDAISICMRQAKCWHEVYHMLKLCKIKKDLKV